MRTPNEIESILIEFFDKYYKIIGDIIAVSIILGLKLVNTGIIQSQQKFSPEQKTQLKTGGIIPGNSPNKGEIITLPDGSQVIPNDISRQIKLNVELNKICEIAISDKGVLKNENKRNFRKYS